MQADSDFPDGLLTFGCGNMGGAILTGWIDAGADPARFTALSPTGAGVPRGVEHVSAQPSQTYDIVLLAIKPQKLAELAGEVARLLHPGTMLISILAGIEIATLDRLFPRARTVRLMPNLAVELRKSPLALHAPALGPAVRAQLTGWMAHIGSPEWIDDEADFDLVTALVGSGPAYLYRFTDALAKAGAKLGLPEEQAARLALTTVEGAALLAARSEDSPGALADKVASPGGSTREGMNILDKDDALVDLLTRTLAAARDRNGEMARLLDDGKD